MAANHHEELKKIINEGDLTAEDLRKLIRAIRLIKKNRRY